MPGDPGSLTFALGWLENLSFFSCKSYAGCPGFLKFRLTCTGLPSFFLRAQLYWIATMLEHFDKTIHWNIGSTRNIIKSLWYKMVIHSYLIMYRGYYMVARSYEFYFRVAKQYLTNERSEWVKYCFCHKKIKFIYSSRCEMFFLLYRQKDVNKIIEGNDRNYVID